MDSFFFAFPAWVMAIIVFVLILSANALGFNYRRRLLEKHPDDVPESLGTLEGSLLGLMALMLAFSFGMGATKFESRRTLAVKEANAIGAAILRTNMYPDSIRHLFLADFDIYIDKRMDYYQANYHTEDRDAAIRAADEISLRMFKRATALSHDPANLVSSQQMVPILNEMIDLVVERDAMRAARIPTLILVMLLLLTMVSAFMSGYSHKAKKRNLVMILAFTLMTTFTLYIVMELDRPQRGLITIDYAQQKIIDLKKLVAEEKAH